MGSCVTVRFKSKHDTPAWHGIAMERYDKMMYDIPSDQGQSRVKSTKVEEEIVVGFEDEVIMLKEQLTEGKKKLGIISIVGMPGLGKTTLARKVYDDPYITHYFHIRAWTYVSQAYIKRDLLLDILHSIVKITNKTEQMSNEKLGEKIYKILKGKRYLIVMDDIWSTGAWDDVRMYLPNDNNGSRVMFTSRLKEVGLHAKPESCPHHLRFLTEEESWELFQKKVFRGKSFPPELMGLGLQIAEKCEGLPLAIVVIAGILMKEEKTKDLWEQVAESVSSYMVNDPNQYMHTLALSYYHLPDHLKPCFLYFGAFLEGSEIPVRKLMWLWIAEGFVQSSEEKKLEEFEEDYSTDLAREKTLEEIAEDYLTDLIERSLVIVSKKRSNGGIKACRMHDLLRHLCLREAEKFKFLTWIHGYEHVSSSHGRICIYPDSNFDVHLVKAYARYIQSLFWFGVLDHDSLQFYPNPIMLPIHSFREPVSDAYCDFLLPYTVRRTDILNEQLSFLDSSLQSSSNSQTSDCLKVLDLWCPNVFLSFEIEALIYLRYLAIHTDDFHTIPPSIVYLSNLETLILGTQQSHIILPENVWMMVKLRHLYTPGKYHIDSQCFAKPVALKYLSPHVGSNYNALQTVSNLCPCGHVQFLLLRTPNLRKLGFRGYLINESGQSTLPNLDFLSHLETLKLDNTMITSQSTNLLRAVEFPKIVKKLTLRGMEIKWEEMWIIGLLPNLEVLKLERRACQGRQWETTGGGFRRLKYLKLKCLGIEEWIASSTHFPSLEHLVLEECYSLKEIPSDFGDIPVLRIIEVNFCLRFTEESARKIKARQEHNGNNWLKILINNQEFFGMTCLFIVLLPVSGVNILNVPWSVLTGEFWLYEYQML
ncbi:hypothetical protein ACSBR2_039405 [Camellia fascicularis]